jgi:isoquinoline 1-oxidoreductase beta subunit
MTAMTDSIVYRLHRRDFLKAGLVATAGFTLGCRSGGVPAEAAAGPPFAPNPFVRITPDNTVTVIAKHVEMGQGTYTGLATIVAEELDADWDQVRIEGAPADASRYNNLLWGPAQGTGGSTAMANSFDQLRQMGAAARALLVAAAAARWGVPAQEISVAKGVLTHPSGKRATFGELCGAAAKLPAPATVTPKDPKDYRLIGKHVARKDSKQKTTGTATFTQDVRLPGLLTAVVAHAPLFGATVKSVDATKAKAVRGVVDVVQVPNGVAVLAEGFWPAKLGRDALAVEWDTSRAETRSSADILAEYRRLVRKPGLVARDDGKVAAAFARAAKTIEATYEFPFLAHAAMEPMNCVVRLSPDGCDVWNGEQFQTVDQAALAGFLGLKPEQVRLNMLYAGGSFGRRANPVSDYLVEAASIAKAIGGRAPIKLVWTREDDTRAGYYRPVYVHYIQAALDAAGRPTAWHHRIVGQSILAGTAFEGAFVKHGIDATSVEGASTLPYAVPNLKVELHTTKLGVPVQWWRSVGHTHTGYATEVFVDELAAAAHQDPFEFRRALLANAPRHRGVLELAAAKAGWGTRPAAGRFRGLAVHESFGSFVAQVAEVSVGKNGAYKVERVVCAVDCGLAINPDVIRAQMEGGIGYGLSAALHGAITLGTGGAVEQSNFHQYQPLRISEMPVVEVHIVDSSAPPTGVGEPGVPPIAPAVANALFQATGARVRSLPIGALRPAAGVA